MFWSSSMTTMVSPSAATGHQPATEGVRRTGTLGVHGHHHNHTTAGVTEG